MNKNGFTLMELLVVIAILGIISLIAIPNMIGISDDVKKENMIDDAKKMISLAKYRINVDYEARKKETGVTFYLKELDIDGAIKTDPDGGEYDRDSSYVKYTKTGGNVVYCVYLKGSIRHIGDGIGKNACVDEDKLYSKKNVVNYE